MEILFEYSDGVRVGLSTIGVVALVFGGAFLFATVVTFLIGYKDGYQDDLFGTVVVSYLVGLILSGLVLLAVEHWRYVLFLLAAILLLAGVPYAAYRLGLRLNSGRW